MSDLLASAVLLSGGLVCELRSDSQSVTAYLDGRPLCTVQRRSVHDVGAAAWRAYRLDGSWFANASNARVMVMHIQAHALTVRERGGFPPACSVELAPDYAKRPLHLSMYRTPKGAWALCGQAPGHRFERLTYLGGKAPSFRTRADLAEWCALVGLSVAIPNGRKRGAERFAPGQLEAASPVACVGGLPMGRAS